MWDHPGPGLEPVSPALAGGFLTTVPRGKPLGKLFENHFFPNIKIHADRKKFKQCRVEEENEKSSRDTHCLYFDISPF